MKNLNWFGEYLQPEGITECKTMHGFDAFKIIRRSITIYSSQQAIYLVGGRLCTSRNCLDYSCGLCLWKPTLFTSKSVLFSMLFIAGGSGTVRVNGRDDWKPEAGGTDRWLLLIDVRTAMFYYRVCIRYYGCQTFSTLNPGCH